MVLDAAWELVIEDYQAGASLDDLAARHRITRYSLTESLKRKGAFVQGRTNRSKFDLCSRGHDLAEHGRQLFTKDGKKNGRECRECKRARQRVGA